jgi:hypothetical protein
MQKDRMKYFTPLLPLIVLTACNGETANKEAPLDIDNVITINMTFDREIDMAVKEIAVVPNNVAPWAGSLFIIDDKDNLLRGDIDRGPFKAVAPNIKDLAPLARENAAGVLLTLTNSGSLNGFSEINDEGDYVDIAFIKTPENISAFCAVSALSKEQVFGQDDNGNVITLNVISPMKEGSIEAVKLNGLSASPSGCALAINETKTTAQDVPESALNIASLDANSLVFTTQDSLTRPRLFLQSGNEVTAIDITGGLTTDAPEQIDSFYVISNPLGGVLRDGALILADNKTGRLIYISLGFLKMRLNEAAPKQDVDN